MHKKCSFYIGGCAPFKLRSQPSFPFKRQQALKTCYFALHDYGKLNHRTDEQWRTSAIDSPFTSV